MPHYPRLVERLAYILRPGGLLVVAESEPRFVSKVREALKLGLRLPGDTVWGIIPSDPDMGRLC